MTEQGRRRPSAEEVSLAQGLPYAVAGVGDMLALFRCISCKYTFSTTTDVSDLLGAPGRIFATGEVRAVASMQRENGVLRGGTMGPATASAAVAHGAPCAVRAVYYIA